VSEIETIREVLADGAELDIKQREMAREALGALEARLKDMGNELAREKAKPGGAYDQGDYEQLAARLEARVDRHADALEQIKRLIDQRDALAARLEVLEAADTLALKVRLAKKAWELICEAHAPDKDPWGDLAAPESRDVIKALAEYDALACQHSREAGASSPALTGVGVSEIETIREGIEFSWANRAALHAALDALEARLKAQNEVIEAARLVMAYDQAGGNEWWEAHAKLYAALARQPSQEPVVPCDQHDAGHQAGWA
jgi:hypothetical protein